MFFQNAVKIFCFRRRRTMERESYQLVSIEKEGDKFVFCVPDATRQFLSTIRDDIMPIAAVGPYRAGKSWMLGALSKQPNAFTTSNGSQACTRGIHINSKPQAAKKLLFMDTEGLGAPGSNVELDSKILACSILFSAKVYFCVTGKIDTKTFDSLQCAIGTANWLKTASDQSFVQHKPQLVVVIKDLTLQLQNDDGRIVGAYDYFHSNLDKYCASNNSELKSAIQSLFCEVKCFTMPIPCADADMKEMKNLSASFVRSVDQVMRDAYNDTNPKRIGDGAAMNGPILLQMAESLCVALSQPGAPRLLNVWEAALEQVALERKFKAMAQFHAKAQDLAAALPLKLSVFDHNTICELILSILKQHKSLKCDDICNLLDTFFSDMVTLQSDVLTKTLFATDTTQDVAAWTSQYFPPSIFARLEPVLQQAATLHEQMQTLVQQLQDKTTTVQTLEDQLATVEALLLTCGSSDTNNAQTTVPAADQTAQNVDELMLFHNTFKTEMEHHIASLNAQIAKMREDMAEMVQANAREEQDRKTATHGMVELQRTNKELQARHDQLKSELDQTNRKRKFEDMIIPTLKQNLETKQQQYNAAMQRNTDLERTVQQLRVELMQSNCQFMLRK